MPRTSAIHCKVDRNNGNTHITQDVVRAILWVLPGCSCAVSFAIAIMSSEQCLHICNTIVTHPVLTSSDHNHSNYSSSLATIILWRHTVWMYGYVAGSAFVCWFLYLNNYNFSPYDDKINVRVHPHSKFEGTVLALIIWTPKYIINY